MVARLDLEEDGGLERFAGADGVAGDQATDLDDVPLVLGREGRNGGEERYDGEENGDFAHHRQLEPFHRFVKPR